MAHPNPERPFFIETDASDFAISGILSQYDADDIKPHPIAFFSRQLTAAEINYDVYDKELLAIIESFKQWRHHLLGAHFPITVFSNHKNLQYFASARQLNHRQARWAQFLSDFDYYIMYRPGPLGGKPDILSRRTDYAIKEGDTRLSQQKKALISPSRFIINQKNHDQRNNPANQVKEDSPAEPERDSDSKKLLAIEELPSTFDDLKIMQENDPELKKLTNPEKPNTHIKQDQDGLWRLNN